MDDKDTEELHEDQFMNGADDGSGCRYSARHTWTMIQKLDAINDTLRKEFLPLVEVASKGNSLAVKAVVTITGGLFFLLILLIAFITNQQIHINPSGATVTHDAAAQEK